MKKSNEALIKGLKKLIWYNGYVEVLSDWIERLKRYKDKKDINDRFLWTGYTDVYDGSIGIHTQGQIEAMNVMLVANFGEYGTSPRTGWIEDENIDELLEILENIYNELKGYDDYEC